MRIVPVTGDLPALVTSPPPPATHVAAPPAPATAPVEHVSEADADPSTAGGDRRSPSSEPFFDPPLIAQRAVLGLPTGLIADHAEWRGVPYAVAVAAVERELPRDAG